MTATALRIMLIIAASFTAVIGTEILISSEPLATLCRRECWLNALLGLLFGESGGKVVLSLLWYSVGALLLFIALRRHRYKKVNGRQR